MNSRASTTADAALFAAYQEWRRLAEQEGEAIRERNWTEVADCQKHLSTLQSRIIRFTALAREEWQRTGADRAGKENDLRKIISGLIELEMRNGSSLAAAKEAARERMNQLDLARQNLKRVQRSYSPLRPAMWNSFS